MASVSSTTASTFSSSSSSSSSSLSSSQHDITFGLYFGNRSLRVVSTDGRFKRLIPLSDDAMYLHRTMDHMTLSGGRVSATMIMKRIQAALYDLLFVMDKHLSTNTNDTDQHDQHDDEKKDNKPKHVTFTVVEFDSTMTADDGLDHNQQGQLKAAPQFHPYTSVIPWFMKHQLERLGKPLDADGKNGVFGFSDVPKVQSTKWRHVYQMKSSSIRASLAPLKTFPHMYKDAKFNERVLHIHLSHTTMTPTLVSMNAFRAGIHAVEGDPYMALYDNGVVLVDKLLLKHFLSVGKPQASGADTSSASSIARRANTYLHNLADDASATYRDTTTTAEHAEIMAQVERIRLNVLDSATSSSSSAPSAPSSSSTSTASASTVTLILHNPPIAYEIPRPDRALILGFYATVMKTAWLPALQHHLHDVMSALAEMHIPDTQAHKPIHSIVLSGGAHLLPELKQIWLEYLPRMTFKPPMSKLFSRVVGRSMEHIICVDDPCYAEAWGSTLL